MSKYILIGITAIIYLGGLAVYQSVQFGDDKLHIVFCDVGQGDGIFITTPSRKQILIDGGPGKSILNCLSEHMPFWDRSIDMVILTHPHQDHFMGASYVIDRYSVGVFVHEDLINETETYKYLGSKIKEYGIEERVVFMGDKFSVSDGVVITIEGPNKNFLKLNCINGMISNCTNQVTLIASLKYENFDALFTGDNETEGLLDVLDGFEKDIEVMQVPHHGSASGLDDEILDAIDPELAIISVGGSNRYGHPKAEILNLLKQNNIKFFRTDEVGNIEIVSDGEGWSIR